jgi:hypothetical protein
MSETELVAAASTSRPRSAALDDDAVQDGLDAAGTRLPTRSAMPPDPRQT